MKQLLSSNYKLDKKKICIVTKFNRTDGIYYPGVFLHSTCIDQLRVPFSILPRIVDYRLKYIQQLKLDIPFPNTLSWLLLNTSIVLQIQSHMFC